MKKTKTAQFASVISIIGIVLIILIVVSGIYYLWYKNQKIENNLLSVQFHGKTYHYESYDKSDDALVGQISGSL